MLSLFSRNVLGLGFWVGLGSALSLLSRLNLNSRAPVRLLLQPPREPAPQECPTAPSLLPPCSETTQATKKAVLLSLYQQ